MECAICGKWGKAVLMVLDDLKGMVHSDCRQREKVRTLIVSHMRKKTQIIFLCHQFRLESERLKRERDEQTRRENKEKLEQKQLERERLEIIQRLRAVAQTNDDGED